MSRLSWLITSWSGRHTVVCSTLLATLLGLWGLGNNDYWDDEANTAVIGRNLIKTGKLTAWDGRNLASYGVLGGVNEDMIKTGPPPLQYLVAGLGLKLFGENTAGGRILFVLIGVLSIPLFAAWFKREFDSPWYWLLALLLALSVPYLLYLRQVRYYSLGLTFSAGLLWVWSVLGDKERYGRWILLGAVFLLLLLLSQYLYAVGVLAILFLSWFRNSYQNRRNVIFLAIVTAFAVLTTAVLAIYSPRILREAFNVAAPGDQLLKFLRLMWMVPRDAARFEFFPVGVLGVALAAMWFLGEQTRGQMNRMLILLGYTVGAVAVISFISPQPVPSTRIDVDMRYYLLLIPFGAAFSVQTFHMLWEWRRGILPVTFLVLLASTNLFTLNFFGDIGFHSRLLQYVDEVSHDYSTGTEAVSQYIEENVSADECIFVVPMYLNMVQMFYHPAHKFCGLVSNKARFAKKHDLREDLFWESSIPDYFIVGGRDASRFAGALSELYGEGSYKLEDVLPIFWANTTRPEIPWRSFGPVRIGDPLIQGILVFKRTKQPVHPPRVDAATIEKYWLF